MSNIHIEFGSDIDSLSNNSFISNNSNTSWLENAYFFRSGRDALRYIAKLKKENCSRIFIPIFCCESMALPFKQNNYEIIYYPIKKDYSIDFEFINSNIHNNDLLIVLNYLGFKSQDVLFSESNKIRNLKNTFNITVIKDYTHTLKEALFLDKSLDDFSVFSVRKWASFPDGGILWSNSKLDFNYDTYSSKYFDIKKKAMDLKSKYLLVKHKYIKDEFLKLFKEADLILETSNSIMEMSSYSKELLYKIDFEKILNVRINNLHYLEKNSPFVKNYSENTDCNGLYFPIYADSQKSMQAYLAKNNIYCPVIWPIDEKNSNVCSFANTIISNMLAVPCDQRYSIEDLDFILKCISKFQTSKSNE